MTHRLGVKVSVNLALRAVTDHFVTVLPFRLKSFFASFKIINTNCLISFFLMTYGILNLITYWGILIR